MDKMTIERDSEMLEVGNTFGWNSQSSKEGPFPNCFPHGCDIGCDLYKYK